MTRPSGALILAAALTTVALVAGCGSSGNEPQPSAPSHVPTSKAPRTVAVVGTMSIGADGYVGNGFHDGAHCFGDDGYDDIDVGAQVTISDDSGHTLAITHLRRGHVVEFECQFKFGTRVPAGKGFYGIEVTHRGVVKEPESKLGQVALTLD